MRREQNGVDDRWAKVAWSAFQSTIHFDLARRLGETVSSRVRTDLFEFPATSLQSEYGRPPVVHARTRLDPLDELVDRVRRGLNLSS